MPRTVLGVVLAGGELTAVHLRGGWKGATATRVERIAAPPGDAAEFASAVLAADLPRADTVVAGLAGDRAFSRIVQLPFTDRAKVARVAPLEAEESLPLPLEQLVCDVQVLGRRGGGTEAFLAAAGTDAVAELVAGMEECGLRPQGVDVAALGLSAVLRHAAPGEPWVAGVDLGRQLHQIVLLGPGGPRAFHTVSGGDGDLTPLAELGGLLGAYPAGRLRPGINMGLRPVIPWKRLALALLGGVLMGVAARFARGCTSGQALTGGALLSVGSWIFMMAVFAGGYLLAPVLRRQWR